MGTRADFYRETDEGLGWLASIGWGGYPETIKIVTNQDYNYITDCKTEQAYFHFLKEFLANRDDVTFPDMGWPWPWDNSHLTDFAYVFSRDKGEVLISCFGRGWYTYKEWDESEKNSEGGSEEPIVENFPDMRSIQNVAWDNRSGLMIFSVPLTEEDN
jgi:hypothetical protein